MQYKVPQNIDMEDRIIGPLTMPQFFYVLFGGVIIYILFKKLIFTDFAIFFWVLAIPIGLFCFAMAFLKVQDRPFPSFVVAAIHYIRTPRQRAWRHMAPEAKSEIRNPKSETKKDEKFTKKAFDALQAQEVAQTLDRSNEK
ncbi:hypothetical protein A3A71_00445 [Candidatus Berkelbacteria bacterium RIFCSPLOWO2_01_FULL_50_28]|uniref:PrgI family protein n=1 Tax=Candidatus Berkelbacteria bacterium RIFCSPLOWO2_01_FULL_50_28 TaxID=1797471 RepID=A0A1F5EAW4_9BACT|nr:MAG: hypothetical protein A2807_01195 [Candidatus Berkelbacteria bacterium RIFCSPHIGHO2_01_FULL_50_36]OGD63566.1 MAG: hypothetical protein A3F39_02595 [Candidatus Berkelbacteria bacterium RIFCSPHIGHO2_12_FULL_50_11]OGD64515.1 MAG: hypothetical protein A3A71_00445 [Candidatus Berkelbacteria bacterium RIFCSPLOWO2_01_FULL_50_28]